VNTLRARPSAGLIISIIALIVALGGTSYAAFRLPTNSVGTKQVKNAAVTGPKIARGAITRSKLNLATLGTVPSANNANHATSAGYASNADHAGSSDNATNAINAAHAKSADQANVAGALGDVTYVKGNTFDVPAGGSTAEAVADCPAGQIVVGDGVHTQFGGESVIAIEPHTPFKGADPTEVVAAVRNDALGTDATDNYVIAICTTGRADNPAGL
jgi:hypothetical protein